MPEIVTLTMNPALDIATATDAIVPEIKLRCEAPRYDPGGGGINVARAATMLGGDALAVFPAGGASGQMIDAMLGRERVPHAAVTIAGITRESLAVVERQSGRQYRFLLPGPAVGEHDQEQVLDRLAGLAAGARFIVASGSLPPGVSNNFYARVGVIAERCGARFVLDSSGAALVGAGAVFLIKASLRELAHLYGKSIDDVATQESAARRVVAAGRCEVLVVSLGAAGALLATADGCHRFPAANVRVVGSIGAGDSMLAGILVALVRGWPIGEAVRFGNAAGAAALLRPGTELCRRDDAERLYRDLAAGSTS